MTLQKPGMLFFFFLSNWNNESSEFLQLRGMRTITEGLYPAPPSVKYAVLWIWPQNDASGTGWWGCALHCLMAAYCGQVVHVTVLQLKHPRSFDCINRSLNQGTWLCQRCSCRLICGCSENVVHDSSRFLLPSLPCHFGESESVPVCFGSSATWD